MPHRLPPHRHWDWHNARRHLVMSAPAAELNVGPVTVRATAVPLFRRDAAGGLEQAVRLQVKSSVAGQRLGITIGRADSALDRVDLIPNPEGSIAHLFVPEVDQPTTFRLSGSGAGATASTVVDVGPQRKWSIYLVHHSHFDYGYTDPQAVVMDHQLQYLDAVLDLVAASDDWPDDARFRWNVEVTYPLQKWLAARPPTVQEEFFARVKAGRIEINALPFSMHSEVYSIDELAWGLRFTDAMRDERGVDIVSAIQSDVPGHTIGLLNLLTAAGIKYLAVAHNYAGRSVPFLTGGQDLTRPFYWQAADGRRLLVWFTDTPHGVAYMDGNMVGLAEGEAIARDVLPEYLLALAEKPYPYGRHAFGWHDLPADIPVTKQPYARDLLHFRIQNTIADNAPPSLAIAETVRTWNEHWAFPRLRLATNREFFEEAERRGGDEFATFEGDWTDWWVDGVGADALPLGINRRAQGTIRTGQTLHALADALGQPPAPAVGAEVDQAYEDLALFDEHTWGAANPWRDSLERMDSGALQRARKAAFAQTAGERADTVLDHGRHRLAEAFRPAPDTLASIVVVNPSSWERTDLVRLLVPDEAVLAGQEITIIDAERGAPVPATIEPQGHADFRAKSQWLSFRAEAVPPLGYARYDIIAAAPASTDGQPSRDPFTLETDEYRVTVDPGQGFITSIVDRESRRELVDATAPFGFNEYIYDTYTSGTEFNHLSGRVQALDLSLVGDRSTADHASLIDRRSDAIAERLTLRLVAEGARWLETTITVPRGVKRVDIANRLHKIPTRKKESVYLAFPFALDDPDPEYEITGGVTSQAAPHIPGSARHMLAIRHWLALRDNQGAAAWATLEAPLIQIGNIAVPYAPFPLTIPEDRAKPSTIYSWPLNNLWDTNFPPEQGGEMLFHYAVASDSQLGARELGGRTAAALTTPLVGILAPARRPAPARELPPRGSFCTVSDPLVQVIHLAAPRDGDGLVAHLHSLAPAETEAEIAFPLLRPRRLRAGSFLERDWTEIPVSNGTGRLTISPGALVTVQAELGS